jgi:hypothetical protein
MKKFWKRLPKWGKIFLAVLGSLFALVLIIIIGLKIWVSTWAVYNGEGFLIRYPQGWDVQDPGSDTNDTQYVYDAGSVLKIGDKATNFPKDENGAYRYQGRLLIYMYKSDYSKNDYRFSSLYFGNKGNFDELYFGIVKEMIVDSLLVSAR